MAEFYRDQYGFIVYFPTKDDLNVIDEVYIERFSDPNSHPDRGIEYDEMERRSGLLGELVFERFMGARACRRGRYDPYDFLVDGKRIDVKCKPRNVSPKPHYLSSVNAYQMKGEDFENLDGYAHFCTLSDFSVLWMCGHITKNRWKDHPNREFQKKGYIHPVSKNCTREDCWNLAYKFLNKFKGQYDYYQTTELRVT